MRLWPKSTGISTPLPRKSVKEGFQPQKSFSVTQYLKNQGLRWMPSYFGTSLSLDSRTKVSEIQHPCPHVGCIRKPSVDSDALSGKLRKRERSPKGDFQNRNQVT